MAASDLHRLPSVDALLRQPDIAALCGALPRALVTDLVRAGLQHVRQSAQHAGVARDREELAGQVVAHVLRVASALRQPPLRHVINATGVVLHTNLGRAPLSHRARDAMRDASGYGNVELDLETGERGSRHSLVESLICRVTGAEAALAVNNNAAALLLVLAEMARGREVIVSRGQAVEIGGGFRIPDVLTQSGARLVEVGTTNRTRLDDYARAIGPETAALLHVHTSNFRVVGFTESVPPQALATLGRERGIPVIDDQGSGCLLDTASFGIADDLREPMVQESVAAGVDLVCFSGDKLLGGPQAGIIAGRGEYIARLKRHPLVRALRLDKVTIAGLAATLQHYVLEEAPRAVPVWQMISAAPDTLRRRARRMEARLVERGITARVVSERSAIGGGSLPGVTLPSWVVALSAPRGMSVDALAGALRHAAPPVVGRIGDEQLLLDLRTVDEEEEPALADVVCSVAAGAGAGTAASAGVEISGA